MGEEGGCIFPIILISIVVEDECLVLGPGRSFSGVKSLSYSMNKRLGGSQPWSERFGEGVNLLPLPRNEEWFLGRAIYSLVTVLTRYDL
jgi:hypothetical protein